MAVPGRRRPPTPRGHHRDGDRLHGERGQRPVAAELADQPGKGLVIGATRGSGQAWLSDERRPGRSDTLVGGCQGNNRRGHAWSSLGMWQGMRRLRRLPPRPDSEVTAGAWLRLWQGMGRSLLRRWWTVFQQKGRKILLRTRQPLLIK